MRGYPVKVSAVVVNYNRKDLLLECLESLARQRFESREIVLVDNASVDGSLEAAKDVYGEGLTVVENRDNLGFSGGVNAGIKASKGEWVALINNDATADPRWLARMIAAADRPGRVGMVAARILSAYQREILDNVGVGVYFDGMSRGLSRGLRDSGLFDADHEVLLPSGCACMYRRSMLDEIGLLDDDFFAYAEDTELGLRARLAGWDCAFAHDAVVYHRYSATSGAASPLKAYYAERNRIRVLLGHYPRSCVIVSPLYTLARYVLTARAVLFGSGKSEAGQGGAKPELALALLRAYADAIKDLPAQLEKRKRLRRAHVIGDREFLMWLKEYKIDMATLTALAI